VGAQMLSLAGKLAEPRHFRLSDPDCSPRSRVLQLLVRTTMRSRNRVLVCSPPSPEYSARPVGSCVTGSMLTRLGTRAPFVPGDLAWFREMVREVTVKMDSDTCADSRADHERCASWSVGAGQLGIQPWLSTCPCFGVRGTPGALQRVLARHGVLKNSHLARLARPVSISGRARSRSLRISKELMESVAFLLTIQMEPASGDGMVRRVLSLHGTVTKRLFSQKPITQCITG